MGLICGVSAKEWNNFEAVESLIENSSASEDQERQILKCYRNIILKKGKKVNNSYQESSLSSFKKWFNLIYSENNIAYFGKDNLQPEICLTQQLCRKVKTKVSSIAAEGIHHLFRPAVWHVLLKLPDKLEKHISLELVRENIETRVYDYISRDIKRTFPESMYFRSEVQQQKLYRILHSISVLDKELSYCQGMNLIVGLFLIVADFDESKAFYYTISLFSATYDIEVSLRGLFLEEFPLVDVGLACFNYALQENLPLLSKHIKSLNIPEETWIVNWIQTCLVPYIPFKYSALLFDMIISEGINAIIRFCLTVIVMLRKNILKCSNMFEFNDLLTTNLGYEKKLSFSTEEFVSRAHKFKIDENELRNIKNTVLKSCKLEEKKYLLGSMSFEKEEFYEIFSRNFDYQSQGAALHNEFGSSIRRKDNIDAISEIQPKRVRSRKRNLTGHTLPQTKDFSKIT